MKLLPLIAASFILFSLMLTPCTSNHIEDPSQDSRRRLVGDEIKFSSPSLPRKLRLLIADNNKNNKANEREVKKRENEWKKASKFMTMDYGPVRRRRPIHNKSLPFSP